MKMTAIAISAINPNKTECVVRYAYSNIGPLQLVQSNDQPGQLPEIPDRRAGLAATSAGHLGNSA